MNESMQHQCLDARRVASHPVLSAIDAAARERPCDLAIEGTRRLSYAELFAEVSCAADLLRRAGVGSGTLTAVDVDDGVSRLCFLLATMGLGATYVPIAFDLPPLRVRTILNELRPEILVRDRELADDSLRALVGRTLDARALSSPRGTPPEFSPVAPGPDDLVYVFYTSGSTGRPKGVAGRHHSMLHFLDWEVEELGMGPQDRVSQLTPPMADPYLRDVLVPLRCGATLCFPDHPDILLDGLRLAEWIEAYGITVMHCVPTLFRILLSGEPPPSMLRSLRYVLLAGEPIYPGDVARWMERYGHHTQLMNLYGPTETTLARFFHRVTPRDSEGTYVPVGRPMRDVEGLILDERMQSVAPGSSGELYIRTAQRSLGYFRRPDETACAFITNPLTQDPEDIVYKTGDRVRRRPDGLLEILGRMDNQVKIRGNRVELGEIESVLRAHPLVNNAAVVVHDAPSGQCVSAFVQPPTDLSAAVLKAWVGEWLEAYKVPSNISFLENFPRTQTGKIDRRALAASAAAPSDERQDRKRQIGGDIDAPAALLASLWSALLDGPTVHPHSDVFQLGATSLHVARLIARLRAENGVEMPASAVYATSSVAEQAVLVAESYRTGGKRLAGGVSERSLIPIIPGGAKRPFFLLPPGSGLPYAYASLRGLVRDRPVYGVCVVLEREHALAGLRERAALYAEAIRAVQPEGPYLIGGWSYGGRLAYETTLQLIRAGQQVPDLILFDSAPPEFNQVQRALLGVFRGIRWLLERTSTRYKTLFALERSMSARPPERAEVMDLLTRAGEPFPRPILGAELEELSLDALCERRVTTIATSIPARVWKRQLDEVPSWMKDGQGIWRCMKLRKLNSDHVMSYHAPSWRYPGRMTYIAYDRDNRAAAWQPYVEHPIKVYAVPLQAVDGLGPHNAMFAPVNVARFAEPLLQALPEV